MRNSFKSLLSTGGFCAASCLAAPAAADVLILTDGITLYGEVVSETQEHVVFRHPVIEIWVSQTFPKVKVDLIIPEEGDQSDGKARHAPAPPADPKENTSPAVTPKIAKPPASPAKPGQPKLALIPLRGTVGGAPKGSSGESFDAAMLRELLDRAQREGAKMVVLDVTSPGGLVSEMEVICRELLDRQQSMRIVAHVRDALSAAAIISLCCREIVAAPSARLGAAVIIKGGAGGISAVDAKFASVHHARQREFMGEIGRPYEIVAAMTIQETQLWWSIKGGFTADPKVAAWGDWQQVDTASSVLTMTADELVAWEVAKGRAGDVAGLLEVLGIAEPMDVVDYSPQVRRYNQELDRRFDVLVRQINNYFEGLQGVVDGMNGLAEAYNKRDRDAATAHKGAIGRNVTRMINSAGGIRRSDRSLLSRRVELPDAMLEQLKTDAELLGRIGRILSSDTIEGFNEARQRVITVLEDWKKLLGPN